MTTRREESAFVLHKAEHVAEALIRNLPNLTTIRSIRTITLDNHVVVLGGGHTLPEWWDGDAWSLGEVTSTIAVNSAIPALLHRGMVPDYVICRESIDMSEQIRMLPKGQCVAILDAACSPKTWAACEEMCSGIFWFISASTQTFGLAAQLGTEPLYAGTSNVTAAVAVAEALGASTIELVGCSRAFSADGRAYAEGSPWATQRLAEVTPMATPSGEIDHYVGHMVGLEAKERMHAASGQRPPLKHERVLPVEGVNGERLWSLETLEGDRRWLAQFASRHPEIRCYQVGPDVAIAGWGHAPAMELAEAPTVPTIAQEAEHVRAIEAATLAGEAVTGVPGFLEGSPLVDFAAAADRLRTMQRMKGRSPAESIPAMLRAASAVAGRAEAWAIDSEKETP